MVGFFTLTRSLYAQTGPFQTQTGPFPTKTGPVFTLSCSPTTFTFTLIFTPHPSGPLTFCCRYYRPGKIQDKALTFSGGGSGKVGERHDKMGFLMKVSLESG